jgi:hypothetical protein
MDAERRCAHREEIEGIWMRPFVIDHGVAWRRIIIIYAVSIRSHILALLLMLVFWVVMHRHT